MDGMDNYMQSALTIFVVIAIHFFTKWWREWSATQASPPPHPSAAPPPPPPPAPPPPEPDWAGMNPDRMLELIEAGFRQLSKKHHPDHGGNTAVMRELIETREEMRRSILAMRT